MLVVKNELIYDIQSISQTIEATSITNQPNRTQSNNKHLMKHERQNLTSNRGRKKMSK